MKYSFRCFNCRKVFEKEISMADYDKLKNEQTCDICGAKLVRNIEWQGIATGTGQGWCGKSNGNAI